MYEDSADGPAAPPRVHRADHRIRRQAEHPGERHHAAPRDQGRVHRVCPGARRVVRAGAAAKHVPDAIFEAPEETLIGFLQGLFDADGCAVSLQNGTRYVGLAAGPRNCSSASRSCSASLGIAGRIYQTGTKKDSFSYTRKDGIHGQLRLRRAVASTCASPGGPSASSAPGSASACPPRSGNCSPSSRRPPGTTRTRPSVLPPVSRAVSRPLTTSPSRATTPTSSAVPWSPIAVSTSTWTTRPATWPASTC